MYSFGTSSTSKLLTCRNELQIVANEAIKLVNFSILVGHRNEQEQNLAFEQGFSKQKFPTSKHNVNPSDAFDFIPYPLDWSDTRQFTYIAGIILGVGLSKGIILRWGGDWHQDGKLKENQFNDLGHIEYVRTLERT